MNKKLFNSSVLAIIVIGAIMAVYISSQLSKRPIFSNVQVTREDITEGINAYGKILSENVADLGFANGGRLVSLTHKVGDRVNKGEILAKIDDTDLEAQYKGALAEAKAARESVGQAEYLLKKDKFKLKSLTDTGDNINDRRSQKAQIGASDEYIDVQKANLSAAEANAENARAQIEKAIIRAPFSGIITKQDVEIGETIASGTFAPGTAVITLINGQDFKVEAFVSEVDVSKISLGNVADITFDSNRSGNVHKAKVTAIDPAETDVNNISSYKVTLKLENPDSQIKSGSDANIKIYNESKKGALVIPQSALISENGKHYVTADVNGKPEKKEVETGLFGINGKAEIISGLSEGDNIINIEGK